MDLRHVWRSSASSAPAICNGHTFEPEVVYVESGGRARLAPRPVQAFGLPVMYDQQGRCRWMRPHAGN